MIIYNTISKLNTTIVGKMDGLTMSTIESSYRKNFVKVRTTIVKPVGVYDLKLRIVKDKKE